MDLNALIEQEVSRRVEEAVQTELNKRTAEIVNNLRHVLTAKLNEALNEVLHIEKKCDFETCKNYGDGSLDDMCRNCDSHKTKMQDSQKITKNLQGSAVNTNTESVKKEAPVDDFHSSVKRVIDQHYQRENKEESKSETKTTAEVDQKTIDSLYTTLEPLLKVYGITREDFNQAKVLMSDPQIKENINSTLKDLFSL